MEENVKSADIVTGSRPIILSDFNGTLSLPKYEGAGNFHKDLFTCLIGWQKSGSAQSIIHTTSIGSSVDGTIRMMSSGEGVDPDFLEFEGDMVPAKSMTDDLDAVAVFDDEFFARKGKSGLWIDPNAPHVVEELHRQAELCRAGMPIYFNSNDFTAPAVPKSELNNTFTGAQKVTGEEPKTLEIKPNNDRNFNLP